MIETSKYSKKIQKYLANELSVSELEEFEDVIKRHPQLQDEIQLYRKVSAAISDSSLENFKRKLNDIHNQNFGSHIHLNTNLYNFRYLVAALFLILITLGILFFFQTNASDPQDVFAKYYHPIEAGFSRSLSDEADVFSQAAEAYNNKYYHLAFFKFKEIVDVCTNNYAARLYLGICGIELGDFKTAEKQFRLIIESKDPFYTQDAEWYLALLFLKMGKTKKAVSSFKEIMENGCVYAANASLVLDDLN